MLKRGWQFIYQNCGTALYFDQPCTDKLEKGYRLSGFLFGIRIKLFFFSFHRQDLFCSVLTQSLNVPLLLIANTDLSLNVKDSQSVTLVVIVYCHPI